MLDYFMASKVPRKRPRKKPRSNPDPELLSIADSEENSLFCVEEENSPVDKGSCS